MKKNIQKLDSCKRVVEIEIMPSEILPLQQEVYSDLQKIAEIPGFRKGKAPREMVEKLYKHHAEKEVLRRSISDFYQKTIEEEELFPIEPPEIYDIKWEWGKPLLFKAKFDVKPEIRLKNYKGLKLKKKKIEINNDEIDKVIKDLQEKNAELVVVHPRPLQKGDYILCDYKSSVGEKIIEKKENAWLSLDENTNFAGFAEKLYGANVTDTRKISLDLPADFPDKNLQGKKIDISVTIKEIKEKKLPVIDDEFAKTVGQFTNLEELKAGIKKDLILLKEIQARKETESKIMELILEANKFSIPKSMVDRYAANIQSRFRNNLLSKGIDEKGIEQSKDMIKKKAIEEAEKQVGLYFILDKIAENEKIEITEEEIDRHIENLARQWKQKPQDLKKNLKDKKLLHELRLELKEEKVISFLLKSSNIEEEIG